MFDSRALCFAALLLVPGSATGSSQCAQQFSFHPNPTLNLASIKRLAQQRISPETTDGSKLVVWSFDAEDRPCYQHWTGLAVIYVTRGDLGEQSIGGLLLQAQSKAVVDVSSATIAKDSDGVTLSLPTSAGCTAFTLHLSNNGTLTAGGVPVGANSDPPTAR